MILNNFQFKLDLIKADEVQQDNDQLEHSQIETFENYSEARRTARAVYSFV